MGACPVLKRPNANREVSAKPRREKGEPVPSLPTLWMVLRVLSYHLSGSRTLSITLASGFLSMSSS
jgi:hypothetical protein